MSTLIERPGSSSDGGTMTLAVIIGAIAVIAIGLIAFTTVDRQPDANVTISLPPPEIAPQSPTAPQALPPTPVDAQPSPSSR